MLLCLEVGICQLYVSVCVGGWAHVSVEQGAVRYYTLKAMLYFTKYRHINKPPWAKNCLMAGHVILSPPLNSWGGGPRPARQFCMAEVLRQLVLDRPVTVLAHYMALPAKEPPVMRADIWSIGYSKRTQFLRLHRYLNWRQ